MRLSDCKLRYQSECLRCGETMVLPKWSDIWTGTAYSICGNAKRAVTRSRRFSRSLARGTNLHIRNDEAIGHLDLEASITVASVRGLRSPASRLQLSGTRRGNSRVWAVDAVLCGRHAESSDAKRRPWRRGQGLIAGWSEGLGAGGPSGTIQRHQPLSGSALAQP